MDISKCNAILLPTPEPIDEIRSAGGEFILFDSIDDPTCDTLNDVTELNDSPVFGRVCVASILFFHTSIHTQVLWLLLFSLMCPPQLPDGSWLQYEPRLILEENTIEAPLADGGGLVQALTGQQTRCANVPRTFLNEQHCTLSTEVSACGTSGAPQIELELNEENIMTLHTITGQYVYGVLGLPVIDFQNTTLESPCTPGLRSRWEILNAADCPNPTVLEAETNSTFVYLLSHTRDENPFLRDISFPSSGYVCGAQDTKSLAEVDIIVGSTCFRRVHPEHLSVYDFTFWTLDNTHPGNMVAMMDNEPNPIKKWIDIDGSVFLKYPSFHEDHADGMDDHHDVPNHSIERWNTHSVHFSKLGRFGDKIHFVDLPNELRTEEVKDYFGDSESLGGYGTMICGSPNEGFNDPSLGYQFDVETGQSTASDLRNQRGAFALF